MSSPGDLTAFLTNNPRLLAIAGALAFTLWVLKLLAEASETISKFVPVLGKYWRRRGQQLTEAAAEARRSFSQRLEDVEADRDHAYRRLKEIDTLSREQQRELDIVREYLIYDSGWHYRDESRAAAAGADTDSADQHKSYLEFEAERMPHPAPSE